MKQESVMVTRRLLLPMAAGDVGTGRCRSASSMQTAELAAPAIALIGRRRREDQGSNTHRPLEVNLKCR
jgi:hypothetical protein